MKKIIYITLCLFLLGETACKKSFLDRPPLGVQTEENFFKSPNAAYKSLVKCYQTFNDAYGYEFPREELGDMATDDAEKGGSDAGDRPFVTDFGYARTQASNESLEKFWASMYLGIGNSNLALENFPKNELIDAQGFKLKDEVKARYTAEIRFLRAYFYFELVRVFGGVPIVDKSITVKDADKLVRATSAETFQFIDNELQAIAADANLPGKAGIAANETGRVNKEAVYALQARVYLFFAKDNTALFANARDAAKKVIDSHQYSLTPNFQDLYLPNSYKLTEPVFSIIHGDNSGLGIFGSFVPVYSSPRGPTGAYGFDQPTQNLVDEFEVGDPRLLFTVIEPGDVFANGTGKETLNFSSYPSTGYHSRKAYLPAARRGPGFGDDAWTFHPIRYADVLLMYAEALLETGGSKQEVADNINLVRHRANTSARTDKEAISRVRVIANNTLPDVTAAQDLRAALRHERRVEFAMEFQRLFDLIRWNSYIETMNVYATKPNSNGKGANFKRGVNELFPIPQVEIDRSGGVTKQNPGY